MYWAIRFTGILAGGVLVAAGFFAAFGGALVAAGSTPGPTPDTLMPGAIVVALGLLIMATAFYITRKPKRAT